jgi:hypothetical protein
MNLRERIEEIIAGIWITLEYIFKHFGKNK